MTECELCIYRIYDNVHLIVAVLFFSTLFVVHLAFFFGIAYFGTLNYDVHPNIIEE